MPELHDWNLTPAAAVELQRVLATRVSIPSEPWSAARRAAVRLVAGVDVSYGKSTDGDARCVAGVIVFELPALKVVATATAVGDEPFPYVPGLLSFREMPVVLRALAQFQPSTRPGLIICDGQGIAHPRRFGLASHLGLWLDTPTIGCAKTRLIGEHDDPASPRSSTTPLRMPGGERIGTVVRTRDNCHPLYVSPGHAIDHDTAVHFVLETCMGYRIPEPTRQADHLVNRLRRELRVAEDAVDRQV